MTGASVTALASAMAEAPIREPIAPGFFATRDPSLSMPPYVSGEDAREGACRYPSPTRQWDLRQAVIEPVPSLRAVN